MFPWIAHIDDVLPHIEGCDEILVADRGNHTVINYMVDTGTTFFHDNPLTQAIRRECRGLIFDQDGVLIRRPLHKFFNINQTEETLAERIDFGRPHTIYEKLDGSSLSPFWLDGQCYMGTRMGSTDVATPVDRFVRDTPGYLAFLRHCEEWGYTPIFEWCSRQQRIVIDHPEDRLVLLAMRHRNKGFYIGDAAMHDRANAHGVPVVRKVTDLTGNCDLAAAVNALPMETYGEGVVVRFDGGDMVKAKTEEYCRLHHAKERITEERHVIADILDGVIDDVLAEQQQDDRDRITAYQAKFWEGVGEYVAKLLITIQQRHQQFPNRKDYALSAEQKADSPFTTRAIFWFYEEQLTYPSLRAYVLANRIRNSLGTRTKCKEMKNDVFDSLRFD